MTQSGPAVSAVLGQHPGLLAEPQRGDSLSASLVIVVGDLWLFCFDITAKRVAWVPIPRLAFAVTRIFLQSRPTRMYLFLSTCCEENISGQIPLVRGGKGLVRLAAQYNDQACDQCPIHTADDWRFCIRRSGASLHRSGAIASPSFSSQSCCS